MGIEYEANGGILARIKEIEDKLDVSIRSYFDNFEFPIVSVVASEHWAGEIFSGAAEDSDADINTTTTGKAYVIADPDIGSPAATSYWLRYTPTISSSYFTIIVDADLTWGTAGAGNIDGGLYITKGAAYDANNYLYIVRRKSTTAAADNITIDGVLNSAGLTAVTAAITDDAVAFRIDRVDDQWRFYYSLTQSPDYTWVYVGYFEDTSNYMTDEVSFALGAESAGAADAESVQVDFDNLKFFINTSSIDQMIAEGYNSTHILAGKNGSVMEMQKYMIGKLATGGGGGGGGDGAETGDVYYVHSSGSDSNTGSYAEPFLTVDYAISQTTANQDDTIVVMASATPYDELANTNGVIVDVAGITIIGEGNEKDDSVQFVNSNGAATSVFDVTAANCHIKNIAITEAVVTVEGIVGSGNELSIRGCRFDGLMENSIHLTGADNLIENNYIHDPTADGIELEGDRNLVRYNEIVDAGTNGISAIAGSDDNLIYGNLVNGVNDTTNGINLAGDDNYCPLNEVANCTNELVDSGTRNFFGETTTGGTMRPNDASLWDWIGGANGLPAFPVAADVANGVSIAEVLRRVVENQTALGASWSVQMFNQAADVDLETTWEQWLTTWGIDGVNVFTDINNATPASVDGIFQAFATLWAADGANVFNPTIYGAAQTDLELALAAMATYLSPAGAAWSVQQFNQVADVDLETTWEQWLATVGVDGVNVWSDINNVTPASMDAIFQAMAALWGADGANTFLPTIYGATRATLELALSNLAIYFSPAGAAWSVQSMNQAADATLEETWEQWLATVGVDGANVWTNISGATPASMDAIFQALAAQVGIDGANLFDPAMFGGAQTTQEAAFAALGTALGAEYDGTPNVYDTLVTGFDSSGTLANRDGSVLERLEEVKSELAAMGYIGTSFFADHAQADDTGDGLTIATAKKTIDAAVNLTTANAGDVVFAFSSDGTAFDENANTAGVELDTAQTAIVALNRPELANSNGAATAVITVTGGRNLVRGFNLFEGSEIWGIYINGVDYNTITDNIIWGDMETGLKLNDSDWNLITDNHLAEMGGGGDEAITIDGTSRSNRISRNFIDNTDKGIELTGTGTQNVIWDNVFGGINAGMATGINIGAGVGHTIIVGNHFNDVADNIADAGTSTDISGNFGDYTAINNTALETDDDQWQALAGAIGIDAANIWSTTISAGTQTTVEASVIALGDVADNTYTLVNAELTLSETGGTLTATGGEDTVYIENSPAGVHKPRWAKFDLDNMVAGDTTRIKVYSRLKSGGTLKVVYNQTYAGIDGGLTAGPILEIPLSDDRFGFKVTLEQTGGTNRDYDWEYFGEA